LFSTNHPATVQLCHPRRHPSMKNLDHPTTQQYTNIPNAPNKTIKKENNPCKNTRSSSSTVAIAAKNCKIHHVCRHDRDPTLFLLF
jgi:hypothetical protein